VREWRERREREGGRERVERQCGNHMRKTKSTTIMENPYINDLSTHECHHTNPLKLKGSTACHKNEPII
jgi:hypothetical protein